MLTNTVTTTGDRYDTTTALVSSLNPSYQAESITFTATVTPTQGSVTPDGTVQFKDGVSNLGAAVTCAAAPSNTCTAQLTTTTLATGTRSITAVYGRGTNHDTSTSNTVSQVNNACTATPITVTTNARQRRRHPAPGHHRRVPRQHDHVQRLVVSPIDLTSGQLTIDKHLTITGPGANLLTVQRTSGTSRIFAINPGKTVTISGLTIAGGNASHRRRHPERSRHADDREQHPQRQRTPALCGGAIFSDGCSDRRRR